MKTLRTAIVAGVVAAATALIGLSSPDPAAAYSVVCTYKVYNSTCIYGNLGAGQASGWSGNGFMWRSKVLSGIGTYYLKGVSWYRSGTYYGPWWGGNGSIDFYRDTVPAGNNVLQQDLCWNGHGSAVQNMTCHKIGD